MDATDLDAVSTSLRLLAKFGFMVCHVLSQANGDRNGVVNGDNSYLGNDVANGDHGDNSYLGDSVITVDVRSGPSADNELC
jgi:hypothetical protein